MFNRARNADLIALTALSVGIALTFASGARADDATMDAWREYAGDSMTPAFAWVEKSKLAPPTLIGRALTPEISFLSLQWNATSSLPFEVSFSSSVSGDSPNRSGSFGALQNVSVPQSGLVRNVLFAGTSRELDGQSRITAGIVLANQQFASFGFGTELVEHRSNATHDLTESTSGTGVRVGFEHDLNDSVSLGTMVQSKVNMEAFQSYRGVFSDPGDFDLPARAGLTARWRPVPFADLSLSAQRIFYSDLVAFSSRSLPVRFRALLNDGSQPELTWRDLDVLSADVGFALSPANRVTLSYSTQQQPEPSSVVLLSAFSNQLTDSNFALGFEHKFDRAGQLRFATSYASSEYYLGNVSGLSAENGGTGSQVEAEAIWRLDF